MSFKYHLCGKETDRLFVPSNDPGRRFIPPDQLVTYNAQKHVSQLMFKVANPDIRPFRDELSLVVFIDGACRGNGTPNARASCGVYFGPDSPYNASILLSPQIPQTSTRAEIEALAAALKIIKEIASQDFSLQQIKIATDSAYLVDAMSWYIEEWIAYNGIGSKGKPVAHFQRLKELNEILEDMQYGDDGGLCFQFWHIPRELNDGADALANQALDQIEEPINVGGYALDVEVSHA